MGIYYAMLILQCFTSWFRMTNREITFGRCLCPFYYWVAPVDEKTNDSIYSDEDEDDAKKRENKITQDLSKSENNKEE